MKVKRLMLSSALAIPALLLSLASCDDSKAPTEPTATDPTTDGIDAPSFTTVGFGSKWHDPHIKGVKVRCFSGGQDTRDNPAIEGGPFFGECKRFSSQDGAEVLTFDDDQNPNNNYAGIYPADNRIKRKLLTSVKELDFSYAGGSPSGGSPRLSIPIDCVQGAQEVGTTGEIYPPSQCTTDGTTDFYAFIDANKCNDGDAFVGVVNGEDKEVCTIDTNKPGDGPYANWAAFVAAHPGGKIADDITFVIVDQPAHYLLFKLDLR